MKTNIVKTAVILLFLSLFIFSCNENKLATDQMSWSPDGTKLAFVTAESKELLIANVKERVIGAITVVEKADDRTLSSPQWSPQGDFLLYTSTGKEQTEILTYSLSSREKHLIQTMPKIDEHSLQQIAAWTPQQNRVVDMKNDAARNLAQFYSAAADGRHTNLLFELKGNVAWYELASNGEWITVSLTSESNSKSAGVWKIKTDGSDRKKIFTNTMVSTFSWSPDGYQLALIAQNKQPRDSTDALIIFDSDGKSERLSCKLDSKITRIEWSPKGNFISLVQRGKEKSNLWILETSTSQLTKISFDNLIDCFGWDSSEKLYFTVDYPTSPSPESSPESDYREFIENMKRAEPKNLFLCWEKGGMYRIDKNMYSFEKYEPTGSTAYFIPYDTQFLGPQIYLPVIRFKDESIEFIARTKPEFLAAADLYFQSQRPEDALREIGSYWDTNFDSPDFKVKLNVETACNNMKVHSDSVQMKELFAGLKNGALLKTIIILRQLNKTADANWVFNQLMSLSEHCAQNPKFESAKDNAAVWAYIETYLKYGRVEDGIHDLDELIAHSAKDSLSLFNFLFAQSVLALEDDQMQLSSDKLEQSLNFVSKKSDNNDLLSFIAILILRSNEKTATDYVPLLQKVIARLLDGEETQQAYEMIGDFYRARHNTKDAFAAYQQAATTHFDQYKIWTKIFELDEH
ncbi:MAG: hypothetical protein ACOY90_13730 [Candidatus Zhuqueibacterota bacterium]